MTTPYSDLDLEAMMADLHPELVERKESLRKAPPGRDGPIERIRHAVLQPADAPASGALRRSRCSREIVPALLVSPDRNSRCLHCSARSIPFFGAKRTMSRRLRSRG
ncbi:MAG: hypothetical protein J4F34_01830 [Gemmatimonadetes bacterium]|nr:hypothetical protein [Gemmatimonadota bacterium]